MNDQTFTVPGLPRGQGRPRFARIGNHVRAYDPAESREWKARVALAAQAAGVRMIEGPVAIGIVVYLARPKRLMRKRDPEGPILATCKPDWDNLGKGVSDALNGIAYADDAQIAWASVAKAYHHKGGYPCTRVKVSAAVMDDEEETVTEAKGGAAE
jgi:Holliday junction resolvase RusA-like endonuclease